MTDPILLREGNFFNYTRSIYKINAIMLSAAGLLIFLPRYPVVSPYG
jgi:hypothetical protein